VVDLRWQLVLDCLGAPEPALSQGALGEVRARLIRTELDWRLWERTVAVARRSQAVDPRKVPKTLRVAFDASALEGAGRVEDTSNVLGHAARKLVRCVAVLLGCTAAAVAQQAGIPVLLAPSVQAGLEGEWTDPQAPTAALQQLVAQREALEAWVARRLPEALHQGPLPQHLTTLHQVQAQNLDLPPDGTGMQVRKGVAPERRCSIEDPEMPQGRTSTHKRFNGSKRHVAPSLDDDLIADARYLQALYFPTLPASFLEWTITKTTRFKQQRLILALCQYRICDAKTRQQLQRKAQQAARVSSKPVYVLRTLLRTLEEQRIVVPGYSLLQETIGQALTAEQARVLALLRQHLTAADDHALHLLLADAPGLYAIT
jgi:hypothetical protein